MVHKNYFSGGQASCLNVPYKLNFHAGFTSANTIQLTTNENSNDLCFFYIKSIMKEYFNDN